MTNGSGARFFQECFSTAFYDPALPEFAKFGSPRSY